MTIDTPSPWKPCDLRGVVPDSISEDLFEHVAAAIGSEMQVGARIVVGGDFRQSTSALKAALIRGLLGTGVHVIDIGQVPTPVVYFHAARIKADGLFVVTASHNPGGENGLKWMFGGRPPTPEDITRIRGAIESGRVRKAQGTVESENPIPLYKEWIVNRWRGLPSSSFPRIVLDAGSGAWSHLAPEVFRGLGFEVVCLHCEPDGRFPHRPPDCARTTNLSALRAAVVESNAYVGIAWDGDGDRVAFVDETGIHATTDEISILFARHLLSQAEPGENVVCDIKLSDGVRREVLLAGGTPLLERSGHAFMRQRLLATNALAGLDACGHYFFREAGSRDDGLYSALFLLGMLGGEVTLGELRQSVGPLFSTPELRLPASALNFETVRMRLRAAFPQALELTVDGSRLSLDQGIVLVRESSTEPIVSLRIEGGSRQSYDELVNRCLSALSEGSSLLRRQIEDAL